MRKIAVYVSSSVLFANEPLWVKYIPVHLATRSMRVSPRYLADFFLPPSLLARACIVFPRVTVLSLLTRHLDIYLAGPPVPKVMYPLVVKRSMTWTNLGRSELAVVIGHLGICYLQRDKKANLPPTLKWERAI